MTFMILLLCFGIYFILIYFICNYCLVFSVICLHFHVHFCFIIYNHFYFYLLSSQVRDGDRDEVAIRRRTACLYPRR